MDIELVLDVYTLNTTVLTTELTLKTIKHLRTGVPNINQFLENNPAPAPASDNSDSRYYTELLLKDPAAVVNTVKDTE
jgi:hypothetical protein